jgi:23S rRNA (guanine2445-N2)-methyltransferase / 23S rRNA (guanine2069-N7)-methyltransferase
LEPLYESMPEVLRRLPTWSHYVLTSFDRFERVIQKQADRRRKLYNARIECTYYQFHGPRNVDESLTAVFGELDDKAVEQAELFNRRLTNRAKHLRKWPTKRGVTCFRLYEKDIPEIPLVVDLYEDHLHLSEFERPHDRDLAAHQQWLDLMRTTAADALGLPHTQAFLKRRKQQKGLSQHEQLAKDRYEIDVQENGLKFIVNLSDYVDTGLFLDHRETRKLVLEEARGKDFLNLFAYTGSFTVYAADGGATSTTSVDLSKRYLQWAERNMKLNGFAGPEHHYISAGIREYITALPEREMFDLAVVDPPTFSNSKSTGTDWVIQDDWDSLLKHVLLRMRTGGVIYFSTNYRRFKFDEDKIPAECHEISKQTLPEDFRNRRIHRCWRIVKNY